MNSPYTKSIFKSFLGFALLGLCLYIFIALISYNSSDPGFSSFSSSEEILNMGGPFGAWISDMLFVLFGIAAYIILALLASLSVESIFFTNKYSSRAKSVFRFMGSVATIICTCSLFEFYLDGNNFPELSAGGYTGNLIFTSLSGIFGQIGSLIFLILFLIPSFALAFNFSWAKVLDGIGSFLLLTSKKLNTIIANLSSQLKNGIQKYREQQKLRSEANARLKDEEAKTAVTKKPAEIKAPVKQIEKDPEPEKITTQAKPITKNSTSSKPNSEDEKTRMPSTELLDRALDDGSSLSQEDLSALASLLELKLAEFGVTADVVSVLPGPVVTRFEIELAPGTKASKVTNIAQDIARSLAVSSVRVVEVIEGKSVVGIEIPNTNRKMVRLTEILSSNAFKTSTSSLSLALGHDIAGKSVVVDLAKMPHLLVAGTTGSGICCTFAAASSIFLLKP